MADTTRKVKPSDSNARSQRHQESRLQSKPDPSAGGWVQEERLVSLSTTILERLLVSEVIDFMRLAVAEVRQFPELAKVGRTARDRAAQVVTQVLSEVADAGAIRRFPAFAPECLAATTRFFMDLVVGRLLMRAVFGEDLKLLRSAISTHVARSVAFFLAGCRHAGSQ